MSHSVKKMQDKNPSDSSGRKTANADRLQKARIGSCGARFPFCKEIPGLMEPMALILKRTLFPIF